MAKESEAWRAWYHSDNPETEPIPLANDKQQDASGQDDGRNQSTTPDLGPLSEFHLLLLLRLLRPDRLPSAMATYVTKHLNLNLDSRLDFGIEWLMDSVANQNVGVLVLLPPSPSQTDGRVMSGISAVPGPTENIRLIADARGIGVRAVTVGEGLDGTIFSAIETAEYGNSWLVVENLHHASNKFFTGLRELLLRIARRRETKNAKFCVWFTSEPCPRIPMDVLLLLHKLAWDALDATAKNVLNKDDSQPEGTGQLTLESGSLESILRKAIILVFSSVPLSVWELTSSLPQNMKCLVYAFGVTQGLLIARQMFGARGLSQFYHFDGSVYVQAIENLVSMVNSANEGEQNPNKLTDLFSKIIYGQAVSNPWDKDYVITAANYIISNVANCQSDTVKIGTLDLPLPPVNVEPADYANWFADKTSDGFSTIAGLYLHGNVDREANDAHAVHFITLMDNLYEAQNLTLGEVEPIIRKHSMNMLRLRAILDNIVEALPPLLELGKVPDDLIKAEYDFPYHQPSVISLATAESVLMPESLGFVLLQECLWHNSLLCHIHQNVHEIHRCLLSGPQSFPHDLVETANSIMEEYVPTSWVHPNCQPCTHSITSWLADLNKRHVQMQGWVKRRMVPLFKDSSQTPESHGTLRSVWLGGLVNPQALMVAMRQEKAVLVGCQYDEIGLVVEVCELPPEVCSAEDDASGLFLTDLYMQGAMWDLDTSQLMESSHDLNSLPGLHVRPELLTNIKETTRYHCPVFMNRARQVCPFYLDLECPEPVIKWILSGTAIILDIGIPPDAAKKSRAFLMPKQTLSSARSDSASEHERSQQEEEQDEEEEEEEYDFGEDQREDHRSIQETERSEESVQSKSQLSYKPMSPQAPPLPPDLQLTREPLMIDEQESKHSSPQAKHQPEKVSERSSSRPTSTEQQKDIQRTPSKQSLSKMSDSSEKSKGGASQRSNVSSQKATSRRSDRSTVSGRGSRRDLQPVPTSERASDVGQDKGQVSGGSQGSAQQQNLAVDKTSDGAQASPRSQTSIQETTSGKSQPSEGQRSGIPERQSSLEDQNEEREHVYGSKQSLGVKSGHTEASLPPEVDPEKGSSRHSPRHSDVLLPSDNVQIGSGASLHHGPDMGDPHHQKTEGQTGEAVSTSSPRLDDTSRDKPEDVSTEASHHSPAASARRRPSDSTSQNHALPE